MAHNTEPTINNLLGEILRSKHPRWRENRLGSEQTQVLQNSRLKPDLLIEHPIGSPVIVETEFQPGALVEQEAWERLGKKLATSGTEIEGVMAIRLPLSLKTAPEPALKQLLLQAEFQYCCFSTGETAPIRWPEKGWLAGDIDMLAVCIEHLSLSERRVTMSINLLELAVTQTAELIRQQASAENLNTPDKISEILQQKDDPKTNQTLRMAMAILANAFIFHEFIARQHDIPPADTLKGELNKLSKSKILQCWQQILNINYWPIFYIASEILKTIKDSLAPTILDRLVQLGAELSQLGATSHHDLAGRMFQRLIVDRKFLATFYTLPTSATLLAELAVQRLDLDWSSSEAVTKLRFADLACGTGTLLSAAYRAIAVRHRLSGQDDREIHAKMMENAIIGADIMPAATHLTASMISSIHPGVTFTNTQIHTTAYGAQTKGRSHALGSLDLILKTETMSLFGTGETTIQGDRAAQAAPNLQIPSASLDLIIMNPPFTRPTNHAITAVPVPSFAGFGTSAAEQHAMSQELKKISTQLPKSAGHGNAGLASVFIDLAHAKLRPGGILALVLPAACIQGSSWQDTRNLLCEVYNQILVVTITTSGESERSFSADTGMAETLIIATQKKDPQETEIAPIFVTLRRRPQTLIEAFIAAEAIKHIPTDHQAGILALTDQEILGGFAKAPLHQGGWAFVREKELGQFVEFLTKGLFYAPQHALNITLPLTRLGDIGYKGILHRDINGLTDGKSRGPFDLYPIKDTIPTYPILWRHDAKKEQFLIVSADQRGEIRPNQVQNAVKIWQKYASRLHINSDFRTNSQPLAACLTIGKTLGGVAWPSFILQQAHWEKLILLWMNSSLGLMLHWWEGSKQQQGRSRITISRHPSLIVLDPRKLETKDFDRIALIFDAFVDRAFLPAHEAYRDNVRQDLDRALLIDLLGMPVHILDAVDVLRQQWCAEPSVHGGKSNRFIDS